MNKLPDGWQYSFDELENAYHLKDCFDDNDFITNIYDQINYLQFLGKSFSYWEFSKNLATSYIQNYLILVSSVIEALLDKIYKEKISWCSHHCSFKPNGIICCSILDNYYDPSRKRRFNENSIIKFSMLIKMAANDGLLDKVSEIRIDLLRDVRNNIHLTKIKTSITDIDILSTKTINSYIKDLKMIIRNVVEWKKLHKNSCIKKVL